MSIAPKTDPIVLLLRLTAWRLWLLAVVLSVVLSEAIVAGMGLLLKGSVPADYLITGLVTSLFVASLVVGLVTYFLGRIRHHEHFFRAGIVERPRLVHPYQVAALLGILMLTWAILSWFIADATLTLRLQTHIRDQSAAVEKEADDLARDIGRNLDYLHGIPVLLAGDDRIGAALARAGAPLSAAPAQRRQAWESEPALQAVNAQLARAASALGVDALWLTNTAGDGVAASNAGTPASFVGPSYADREYFQAARDGKYGQQYAVGRVSHVPGLYFSAPVASGGAFVGAAVAKVNIAHLSQWIHQNHAFITDRYGIVILARDHGLEMRAMPDAGIASLNTAERLLRYRQADFPPLGIRSWGDAHFPTLMRFGHDTPPFVIASRALPGDKLGIHLLRHIPEAARLSRERAQLFFLLAASGALLLLAAGGRIHLARTRRQAEQQMAQSLSLLHSTLESTADGILVVDLGGHVTASNQRFADIWHIPPELLASRDDAALLSFVTGQLDNPQNFLDKVRELYANPSASSMDTLLFRDGRVIERHSHPQMQGEEIVGRVWSFRDITERRLAEQKQTESELRLHTIIETQPECIKLLAPNGSLKQMNRAGLEMIEADSAGEVLGHDMLQLVLPEYRDAFAALTRRVFAGESGKLEFEIRGLKGAHRWLETHAVPMRDVRGNITALLGITRDISQRKEDEEQIRNLAFYDPLTRLPNRRLLLDRLGQALAASKRGSGHGALMFFDLDQFKTLNDTRGHDTGDQLLMEVARRLQASVRESDTVARLGGDEFVVLLENLDEDKTLAATQAETVAEKLRDVLNRPYALGASGDYHCSASIGISLFLGQAETREELLKRADVAMYQAKAAGRNAIRFFDPDMQAALEVRMALESELRHALAERELTLHYQAQVGRDRRVFAAEVLLRWNHPRRGVVYPGDFIRLAEETGLIVAIGQWVLETACAQLKAWADDPHRAALKLAVNVSPRQFRQKDFVAQVRLALTQSGARPECLKLELTESLVLDDVAGTIAKMHELRALGVGFSMDDFGTGYSSLSYLKQLPLDQLKIGSSGKSYGEMR